MKIDGLNMNTVSSVKGADMASKALETGEVQLRELGQENSDVETVGEVEEMSDELIDNSVKQANKALEAYDKVIERSVHEKTKTMMYVLKDTKTKEVIREFPPKKIQDMIAKMWELAGLFVDEKA